MNQRKLTSTNAKSGRKYRNITVSVAPETYRNARRLAAGYDTTVSALTAYFFAQLPAMLKRTNDPNGIAAPISVSTNSTTPSPYAPSPKSSRETVKQD